MGGWVESGVFRGFGPLLRVIVGPQLAFSEVFDPLLRVIVGPQIAISGVFDPLLRVIVGPQMAISGVFDPLGRAIIGPQMAFSGGFDPLGRAIIGSQLAISGVSAHCLWKSVGRKPLFCSIRPNSHIKKLSLSRILQDSDGILLLSGSPNDFLTHNSTKKPTKGGTIYHEKNQAQYT